MFFDSFCVQMPLGTKDLKFHIIVHFPQNIVQIERSRSNGSVALNIRTHWVKSSVLHRILNDPGKVLSSICTSNIPDTRCQIEESPLWQSSSNQGIGVTMSVPDGFQSTGCAETIEEFRNSFVEVCADLVVWNARDGGI